MESVQPLAPCGSSYVNASVPQAGLSAFLFIKRLSLLVLTQAAPGLAAAAVKESASIFRRKRRSHTVAAPGRLLPSIPPPTPAWQIECASRHCVASSRADRRTECILYIATADSARRRRLTIPRRCGAGNCYATTCTVRRKERATLALAALQREAK